MRKYLKYIGVVCFIVIISSWLHLNRDRGNQRENFEYFFKTFEEKYALFEVKDIDWNALHSQYETRVHDSMTDDELFKIFQEVLYQLNDKHSYIYRFNEIYFSGYNLPVLNYFDLLKFDFRVPTDDFSLKLIKRKYLKNDFEKRLLIYSFLPPMGIRSIFTTGWLSDSIAYIHMTEMSNKTDKVYEAIDDFFEKYDAAHSFVIDIRDNIGGYSLPVKALAERFTNNKQIYAISRLRAPESINTYQKPENWIIEPTSQKKYSDRQVALLTNKNTQSAAELLTLMMKTLPNVTLIGDTTTGIFSDTHIGKLPNGWEYRMSIRKTCDADDLFWEDIGIAPDILIKNEKKDIDNGIDKVLDYSIQMLTNKNR